MAEDSTENKNPSPTVRGSNVTITDDLMKKLLESSGIYDRQNISWYNKISRFGSIDPYNRLYSTREYVWFTKPDLHLFENRSSNILNPELENIPFFQLAFKRYRKVMMQLQQNIDGDNSQFMNLLFNARSSNLDLPEIDVDNGLETSANVHGTKLMYRKSSYSSDGSYDFTVEFEDSRYLEVYMLFKIYDEYEKLKTYGLVTPPSVDYTDSKILHDQFSIFKFIVNDVDPQSVLFYTKFTGVFPKSVPRQVFSELPEQGQLKFTIQFHTQFVEDTDPIIVDEFNDLNKNFGTEVPLYDKDLHGIDGTWVKAAKIVSPEKNNKRGIPQYELRWS